MNAEDFSKWCDMEIMSEQLAKTRCGVVRNGGEDLAKNISLELTLNPSNTKEFDSSELSYIKIYQKILNYIKKIPLLFLTGEEYEFEYCQSGKRHFHAIINLQVMSEYSIKGLIEELARFICKLLRRKYKEECSSLRWNRYRDMPFCISESCRIEHWKNYIKKTH